MPCWLRRRHPVPPPIGRWARDKSRRVFSSDPAEPHARLWQFGEEVGGVDGGIIECSGVHRPRAVRPPHWLRQQHKGLGPIDPPIATGILLLCLHTACSRGLRLEIESVACGINSWCDCRLCTPLPSRWLQLRPWFALVRARRVRRGVAAYWAGDDRRAEGCGAQSKGHTQRAAVTSRSTGGAEPVLSGSRTLRSPNFRSWSSASNALAREHGLRPAPARCRSLPAASARA